jgi:hypothetical protein
MKEQLLEIIQWMKDEGVNFEEEFPGLEDWVNEQE